MTEGGQKADKTPHRACGTCGNLHDTETWGDFPFTDQQDVPAPAAFRSLRPVASTDVYCCPDCGTYYRHDVRDFTFYGQSTYYTYSLIRLGGSSDESLGPADTKR
jgi:hypothetical protein